MCRYIASASARGRELSGRVRADAYNFAVLCSGPAPYASDIVMAGLNVRGLQSKLLITPLSERSHNNYYTAGMLQPKITTCTRGLATVVITLGNLASGVN